MLADSGRSSPRTLFVAWVSAAAEKGSSVITNYLEKPPRLFGYTAVMPRTLRADERGLVDHVLNRPNGHMRLFGKEE